jgi:PAS domain S-box-containing protein
VTTSESDAEQLLRESEERFRGAFDYSCIGSALVSPEGRFLKANAALCNILGYSEAELLSKTYQELSPTEDIASSIECAQRLLSGEGVYREMEKRYIHKGGHTVPVMLNVCLVRGARGQPLYFVAQMQDLTERHRASAEIEHLRRELAHSGRVSVLGLLTASLTHELLQPLTVVLASAEAGQRVLGDSGSDPRRAVAHFTDILEGGLRAREVIDRVRNLLMKGPVRRVMTDLNSLVIDVCQMMQADLDRRGVRLVRQLSPSLPKVMADPVEVQQVILNLLANGADALTTNPPGQRELVVRSVYREPEVELSVCDCGPAIDPAVVRRMFEPFFSTKPQGMGMGLAICSEIVAGHGGKIWATKNPSSGLTVSFSLPAVRGIAP